MSDTDVCGNRESQLDRFDDCSWRRNYRTSERGAIGIEEMVDRRRFELATYKEWSMCAMHKIAHL